MQQYYYNIAILFTAFQLELVFSSQFEFVSDTQN